MSSPVDNSDDSALVLCDVFPDAISASIAQGMLRNNDIDSILENEVFSSIYPLGLTSVGSVRLLVRQADLSKASRLILDHRD